MAYQDYHFIEDIEDGFGPSQPTMETYSNGGRTAGDEVIVMR